MELGVRGDSPFEATGEAIKARRHVEGTRTSRSTLADEEQKLATIECVELFSDHNHSGKRRASVEGYQMSELPGARQKQIPSGTTTKDSYDQRPVASDPGLSIDSVAGCEREGEISDLEATARGTSGMELGGTPSLLTVIDSVRGEGIQIGNNNKTRIMNRCIINIKHIHHHHHHHHYCESGSVTRRPALSDTQMNDAVAQVQDEVDRCNKDEEFGVFSVLTLDDLESSDAWDSTVTCTDNVCIMDSWGSVLQPGCVVGLYNIFHYLFPSAIYIGNGEIVRCMEKTKAIVREKLELTKPFYRRGVMYGSVPIYDNPERVRRALGRAGDVFTEGSNKDFVCWCYTGKTNMKALRRFVFGR